MMKKVLNSLLALPMLLGVFTLTSCEEAPVEGAPVLTASTGLIVGNGQDHVVLTVSVEGIDVTDDAAFYCNELPFEGNVFATTSPRDYVFHAIYNGNKTNAVKIKVADSRLYANLPADTDAERFFGFAHKVLLTQATGTWCGYCPYMIKAIELFREEQAYADSVVVVATHSGDNLSSNASEAVIKVCRVQGFPTSAFNLDYENLLTNNDAALNAVNINSRVKMELMEKAHIGIAAASKVAGDKISVRTSVKVGTSGAYRVNAWLIENGVMDVQSSYWPEFSDGKGSITMAHDFVLRDAATVTPIQGELLGGKESCEVGETIEFYHEFSARNAAVSSISNCKIVVLVSTILPESTRYVVNNVIECPVGGATPFAYN